jgi:hypothetical protein
MATTEEPSTDILELISKFDAGAANISETIVIPLTYERVIELIRNECKKINLKYDNGGGDGRITSAIKEKEYLDLLTTGLQAAEPQIKIERPKDRAWYDIRIQGIPINLKLSTGGTDNAFNKTAVIFTLTGKELTKKNINFNKWFNELRSIERKTIRDKNTEYHYLVVDKETHKVLLKSILDIHTYKTNPCNILQINWDNEFKNIEYFCENFIEKTMQLMKTIQSSLKQQMDSMKEFCEADLVVALALAKPLLQEL